MTIDTDAFAVRYTTKHGLTVERTSAKVGAEISGLDLRQPTADGVAQDLRDAILAHGVIMFHNQPIDDEQFVALGKVFGELNRSAPHTEHEYLGTLKANGFAAEEQAAVWHTDGVWMDSPPNYTGLRALIAPPLGGDTWFASGLAAYRGLSAEMKQRVDTLRYSASMVALQNKYPKTGQKDVKALQAFAKNFPPTNQPVVRVHLETDERVLFTCHVEKLLGLNGQEEIDLLRHLSDQFKRPEYQTRIRWREGSVVIWDNRTVQHYAVPDQTGYRLMQRFTVGSDKPLGIAETRAARAA